MRLETFRLEIWGARGSHPASGQAFCEFGHHTACLAVRTGDHMLVLDAGTGASALAAHLAAHPPARIDILLSHFHHDHVMGLPYLLMALPHSTRIRIHAAFGADFRLEAMVSGLMSPPYFPAGIRDVLRRCEWAAHGEGVAFEAGAFTIDTHPLDHPGGSTAFRVSRGGRSFVYATDVEQSDGLQPGWIAFVSGADMLIHDTMFTDEEWRDRRGWGHATIAAALRLAEAAGISRLVGFHHNPAHDDGQLRRRERDMARRWPGASLAREGETLEI